MKTLIFAAILLSLTLLSGAPAPQGPATAQSALTGMVSSPEENRMEGVLVSAKRAGSNRIVTVVSNADGVYSFPKSRLDAGSYEISIRATGYVLPPSKLSVEVTAASTAHLDLGLRRSNPLELAYS
jgi:virginiamycin B lyase